MTRELISFIENLEPDFKTLKLEPRQGLHILLEPDQEKQGFFRIAQSQVFRKSKSKSKKNVKASLDAFLLDCARKTSLAWTVNGDVKPYYQKCLDLPQKGIHSASPFCLGFKKTSIEGGAKYAKDDNKIYERLERYFDSTLAFVTTEDEHRDIAEKFAKFLKSRENIRQLLASPKIEELDESEYIVFYLNVPNASYERANEAYLGDKLFNQSPKPRTIEGKLHGVGTFFKTLNAGKPLLKHLTATFDIAGWDSASDVKALQEFSDMVKRKIFPNPLPIFIYGDERPDLPGTNNESIRKAAVSIFKVRALIDDEESRKSHAEIIAELYKSHKDELHNYYLFYFDYFENKICDFDFISKFEYELKSWQVEPLFDEKFFPEIPNVFTFQNIILPVIFNNALVKPPQTEGGKPILKFFEKVETRSLHTHDTYHILTLKHRKAFYDFIYKSRKQAITQTIFEDVLMTGIMDDLRRDRIEKGRHTQRLNLFQKLNILFSLHQNFIPNHSKSIFMAKTIQDLRIFMADLAEGKRDIQGDGDEEFAFASGQVIAYLMSKSKADDRSYARLVPLLQQPDSQKFVEAIAALFVRYAHEPVSNKFRNAFPQISIYSPKKTLKELTPLVIAGALSTNALFSPKNNDGNND